MIRRSVYILLTILPFFLLSACASGSKSKKDPLISRLYHNLTARDNGYFNAKLLLAQSQETLWDDQEEDFTETLPVYKFGDKDAAQGEQSNLDEVIKKSSIVIQLHKKSKWVDDCYMLIGQSNFYKKEYDEAITSFQYIISKYSDTARKKKKRKKKKSAADESWLSTHLTHQPVANEAALWVVLTLTEKGDYAEAKTALSVIKGNQKFPKFLEDELAAVESHLFLKQKQYKQAMGSLQQAEELTKDKALKARYAFILAQLYANGGEYSLSQESFQRVIKYKPDYVTDFYARLYIATQGIYQPGVTATNAVATLTSMLKEDKYKEFYPLIYNTLADIELNASNLDQAMDYLKEGIRTGDVNPSEKALSYVRLGDIYYEKTEYKPAYNQYDSALQSLDRTYPRYKEIETRRDGLIDLVKALTTIETEKKLQYLASLNEFELDKELDKMIAEQEAANQQEFLDGDAAGNDRNEENTGEFYFYNATLLSRGFGEFKKVWGTRGLEDNWRRSDKRSFDEETLSDTEDAEAEESEIDLNSDQLTKEDIINSLPRSPEDLEASNRRIAGALYTAGNIYRQKFLNDETAVAYFKENINEYPDNPFELQSLYQLYVIFDGNPGQDLYRSTILDKYPESLFANIIRDPGYLEKQLKKNEQLEDYYTTTYDYYTAGDLATVNSRINAADSLFPDNPLKPKFDMLAALTLSDTASIGTFVAALQDIVDKYPTDEVGIRAKAILNYINKTGKAEEEVDPSELYSYDGDEEHYVILVVPSKGKEATSIKNALADFNTKNYNVKKLRVSSLLFGPEQTLILIKTFTDAGDAMSYYNFVDDQYEDVFEDIDMDDSYFFVVSKSNYVQLYKSKKAETYEGFFVEYYLTEE